MHPRPLFAALLATALLAACATPSRPVRPLGDELAGCIKATGQSQAYLLDVPAPNNAVSTQMAIATLEMGGSSSVDELVRLLKGAQVKALAVTGASDALTAATLRTALGRLPARTDPVATSVCFAGDARYAADLRTAAQRAGVPIFFTAAP